MVEPETIKENSNAVLHIYWSAPHFHTGDKSIFDFSETNDLFFKHRIKIQLRKNLDKSQVLFINWSSETGNSLWLQNRYLFPPHLSSLWHPCHAKIARDRGLEPRGKNWLNGWLEQQTAYWTCAGLSLALFLRIDCKVSPWLSTLLYKCIGIKY